MTNIKKIVKYKNAVLILLTLLIAGYLRLFNLDITPSGFHADEASFYVNALSLKQNLKDEDNKLLPLSLNSLIDPKPALFSYIQVPFLFLVKNQILASRLPSFILAITSLIFIYLLTKELINEKLALITLFIFAISPWHIIISRGTQEVISSFTFLIISFYLLIKITNNYLNKKYLNIKLFIPFIITSFLSMYFYHSTKIVLPIFSFLFLFFSFFLESSLRYRKRSGQVAFILLLTIFITGIASLLTIESNSRLSAVGIFNDQAPKDTLLKQTYSLHNKLTITYTRIFYNKVTVYSHKIINEYLNYFSPNFLFLKGGKPLRYKIPDHGLLYFIDLPLFLIGLYFAINKKQKWFPLFLSLLITAPIPAMLTTLETPSIIRSFAMILPINIFIAYGIYQIFLIKYKLLKYLVLILIVMIYLWQIGYFLIQYHIQAYYNQPWYRNSPYTDIAKEVSKINKNYQEIIITNDLRPLYLYFVMENLIQVQDLQNNPNARNNSEYKLNKFKFNRGVCKLGELKTNVLYIAETQCRDRIENASLLKVVKTITYQDGTPVYELLQIKD